jgi:hypothetical protein
MSESTTAFPQVSSVLGSDDCLVNAAGATSRITFTLLVTAFGTLGVATLAAVNAFTAATNTWTNSSNVITINPASALITFSGNGNNTDYGPGGINIHTQGSCDFRTQGSLRIRVDDSNPNLKFGSNSNAGIEWIAAGVLAINDGTVGDAGALELKASASDAGAPSSGLRIYSKLSGGSMLYQEDAASIISFAPRVFKLAGVNLLSTAQSTIFTVPAGRTFYCTKYWIVFQTVNGVTGAPAISIIESGTSQLMYGLTGGITTTMTGTAMGSGQIIHAAQAVTTGVSGRTACAAGNNVLANVTAGSGTGLTADVYVEGFFV